MPARVIAGSVWIVVPLSIGYGTEVVIGGGGPNLFGVGDGGGIVAVGVGGGIVAVGVGGGMVAVGVGGGIVAVGVGFGGGAVAVGVGNVTAAVLRSTTSSDCGSVNVTRVPRPKMTRFVSIRSPFDFCRSWVLCACAMRPSLPRGRNPWTRSEVLSSRSKSKSTGSESRVAFGLTIIICPAFKRTDSPRTPLR